MSFLKAIRQKDIRQKAEMMNLNWMSNNATKEGLEQITKTLLKEIKTKTEKINEVKNNILALQKLQSTLK